MRTPKEHLISLYGIFTESDIIILTRTPTPTPTRTRTRTPTRTRARFFNLDYDYEYEYEHELEHELEYRPGKAEPTLNLIGSLSGRINKFDDAFNVTFSRQGLSPP